MWKLADADFCRRPVCGCLRVSLLSGPVVADHSPAFRHSSNSLQVSINDSIDRLFNRSIDHFIDRSFHRSIILLIDHFIDRSFSRTKIHNIVAARRSTRIGRGGDTLWSRSAPLQILPSSLGHRADLCAQSLLQTEQGDSLQRWGSQVGDP